MATIFGEALRGHDERARAEKKAEAERKVQLLQVCEGELKSVKKGRSVYEMEGGVLYLSSKTTALSNVKRDLEDAKEERNGFRVHSGELLSIPGNDGR